MKTALALLLVAPISAFEGWTFGESGESCDDTCARETGASVVCRSERMQLVNSKELLVAVNVSIASVRGPAAGFACTNTYSTSSTSAPYVSGNCYWKSGGLSTTCSAQSGGSSRICCCAHVSVNATAAQLAAQAAQQGAHVKTVCPLQASDCGTGFIWLPTTTTCANSSTAKCPAGSWRNESGAIDVSTNLMKPICVSCVKGRYGGTSGKTSAAEGCAKGCAKGKFGNVTGQSMESKACFDCDLWGRETPQNSTVCVGYVRTARRLC